MWQRSILATGFALAVAPGCSGTDEGGGNNDPNDLSNSAECDAYCAATQDLCGFECIRQFSCEVRMGDCQESTKEYLKCAATHVQCVENGVAVVGCMHDSETYCE